MVTPELISGLEWKAGEHVPVGDGMVFVGIDPGKSGAIAVVSADLSDVWIQRMDTTERDVFDFVLDKIGEEPSFAMLERVSAMPKQGVSSTFKFGQSYGFVLGLLTAMGIPFERVTPGKWQGAMKCRSGGDKNVTKARAQELFPKEKVIHKTADALLLAEYCRRVRLGLLT